MTATDTGALRELLAKATPGPWDCADGPKGFQHRIYDFRSSESWKIVCDVVSSQDANLILAAIRHLPALLDELDAARARIAELEAWQPIETAPKGQYDTIIAGFAPDECGRTRESREMFYSTHSGTWKLTSDPQWNNPPQPTHWRPLPAPPAIDAAMADSTATEGR